MVHFCAILQVICFQTFSKQELTMLEEWTVEGVIPCNVSWFYSMVQWFATILHMHFFWWDSFRLHPPSWFDAWMRPFREIGIQWLYGFSWWWYYTPKSSTLTLDVSQNNDDSQMIQIKFMTILCVDLIFPHHTFRPGTYFGRKSWRSALPLNLGGGFKFHYFLFSSPSGEITLWDQLTYTWLEHGGAPEWVDVFPIEHGHTPASYVRNYQRVWNSRKLVFFKQVKPSNST